MRPVVFSPLELMSINSKLGPHDGKEAAAAMDKVMTSPAKAEASFAENIAAE